MTVPGIQTGPLIADPEILASGIDAVPSGVWEGSDPFSASRALGRYLDRGEAETGPALGPGKFPSRAAPTMLDPEEANEYFRIPGQLSFAQPVPVGVARNLYDTKRQELVLQDVARRAPGGVWEGAKRIGASFIANALDPLNVAASMIPVVGEARYAAMMEAAGSAIGRAGVRAGVGAAAGAVGQIPLEAMRYGLAQDEHSDWTMASALNDVIFGAALGGALHAGGGMVHDALFGAPRPADVAPIVGADRETQEAAMRTALAQVSTGAPVEVSPVFDLGRPRTMAEFEREHAALGQERAGVPSFDEQMAILRGRSAMPEAAPPMMSALRRFGPVADENGELAALDINNRTAPGLVSKDGRSLDDAALHLWEQGYFPEKTERPIINDLLSAIDDERRGQPRYRLADAAQNEARDAVMALSEELDRRGFDLRQMSNGEIARELGVAGRGDLSQHDSEALSGMGAVPRLGQAIRRAAGEPSEAHLAAVREASAAPTGAEPPKVEAPPAPTPGGKGAAPVVEEGRAAQDPLEQAVRQAQEAGALPGKLPEIDAADAEIRQAGAMGSAWQAAAMCLARAV